MGYNTFIVLIGTGLLGACSGMVGTFAVLRRRALMGDALAHAALPGVCLAFLVMEERHLPAMLLGAFLAGILGISIITGLRYGTRIKEDAAIGIVLSVFYGGGIALSRVIQNQTTGGSRAGLESYILGKTSGMIASDVALIGGAALLCLLFVLLLYKEFKVVVFDPAFAGVQGWPAFFIDLALMAMVAVTVVIGLPAVGVVLMAALLIIPAAAARFWTERLGIMLCLAALIGAVTGSLGTLVSSRFGWAAGPSIVLVGTFAFLLSMLFSPRRGLLHRITAGVGLRRKLARESLLRSVFSCLERTGFQSRTFNPDKLPGSGFISERKMAGEMRRLQRGQLLECHEGSDFLLTQSGWERAVEAERLHRLWELALTEMGGSMASLVEIGQTSLSDCLPDNQVAELERLLVGTGRDPREIELPANGDSL
jgi:manganese/zinc/iron transport system permease protein